MTHPRTDLPGREFYDGHPDVVSSLLNLGFQGPVDPLARRLSQKDGENWLVNSLRKILGPGEEGSELLLLDPKTSSARLVEWKEKCKSLYKSAENSKDEDASLGARLGYFLSIAANLAHHGVLSSGQPARKVRDALLELAEALPRPWDDLVVKGLDRLL